MTWTNETLRDFGWNIQRLIEKKDLSRIESYEMFCCRTFSPICSRGPFWRLWFPKGKRPGRSQAPGRPSWTSIRLPEAFRMSASASSTA
jgi:hypothetical protein